jgi:hypothetical protein
MRASKKIPSLFAAKLAVDLAGLSCAILRETNKDAFIIALSPQSEPQFAQFPVMGLQLAVFLPKP